MQSFVYSSLDHHGAPLSSANMPLSHIPLVARLGQITDSSLQTRPVTGGHITLVCTGQHFLPEKLQEFRVPQVTWSDDVHINDPRTP